MSEDEGCSDIWRQEQERFLRPYLPVLARLRGRGSYWHRTSIEGLRGILRDGEILPSGPDAEHGRYRESHGAHLRAVCMFDFDTAPYSDVREQARDWGPFLIRLEPGVVLEVPAAGLDPARMRHSMEAKTDHRLLHLKRIPRVEAWHVGPIPVSRLARALVFRYADGYPVTEFPIAADLADRVAALAAQWAAEDDAQPRSELNLAAVLEEARKRRRE